MRLCPTRLDFPRTTQSERVNRAAKGVTTTLGELFTCDTVQPVRNGFHRYVFTFIDPLALCLCLGLATYTGAAAAPPEQQPRRLCAAAAEQADPHRYLLSDNGSESLQNCETERKRCAST